MLISVCKNGKGGRRWLVLAPDTPGLDDLAATAEGGELAFMQQEISGVHIDALIGTVTLTGRGSLADVLRDGAYTDLALVTHGDCDAVQLTREQVSGQELARLLSQHNIGLVMAMTCNSQQFAAGLVASGVQQVVCTRGAIENRDARAFMREFLHALVRGMGVTESVTFARSRMRPEGAHMVLLLPDEAEGTATPDPYLALLQRLQLEQQAFRQEMNQCLDRMKDVISESQKQHSTDLKNLTAAMVAMAEVLTR